MEQPRRNARDERDNTELHRAVKTNDAKLARRLILSGAIVDSQNKDKETPLHLATIKGNTHIMEMLIEAGANMHNVNALGRTGAHHAAFRGQLDVVKVLLKARFDVDFKNEKGETLLHLAAGKGHKELVQLLIRKGARVDAKNNIGDTALHYVAKYNSVNVVQELIDSRATVDIQNNRGQTPLHLATNKDKETPLHLAKIKGNTHIMEMLIEAGANMHNVNALGTTGAHHAAFHGQLDVVKVLLKARFDVDFKNEKGETLLHLAAGKGHKELVQLLIRKGARVDAKNNIGNTALHYVVKYNSVNVVQELIDSRATVDIQNNRGQTPLHLATNKGYSHIMEILIKGGGDIYNFQDQGTSGAHHAAFNGDLESLEVLLKAGLDVNLKNEKGNSLLHLAAREGHIEIVQLLLKRGGEVNAVNNKGKTPLQRAAYFGRTEIVTALLAAQPKARTSTDGLSFMHAAARGNRLHTIQTVFTDFLHTFDSQSLYRGCSIAECASAVGGSDCTWWLRKQVSEDAGVCGPSTSNLDYSKEIYEVSGSDVLRRAGKEGWWDSSWLKKSVIDGQIELHYMDEQGDTALHAAVRRGNKDAVRYLVEVGALLVARNHQNLTPVDIGDETGANLLDYLPQKPNTRLDGRIASQLYSDLLSIIAQTVSLDVADSGLQGSRGEHRKKSDILVQEWKLQVTKIVSRLLAWGVPHERLGSCDRLILPVAITTNNRILLPVLLAAGYPLTTTDSGLGIFQLAWLTPDVTIWVGMVVTRAVINILKCELEMLKMQKDEAEEDSRLLLIQGVNDLILKDLSGEKPWEAWFRKPDSASLTRLYITACRYGATLTAWYVWKAGGSNYHRALPSDCTSLEAALSRGHFSTAFRLVVDMDANPFLKNQEGELLIDLFPEESHFTGKLYLLEVMLGKDYRTLDKMVEKFKDEDDKRDLQQVIILLVVLFLQYTVGTGSISLDRWESFLAVVVKAYERIDRQETLYSSSKWMLSLSNVLVNEGVNGIKFKQAKSVELEILNIKKDIELGKISEKLNLGSVDDYFYVLFSTLQINFREITIPRRENFISDEKLNFLQLKALEVCCEKSLALFLHLVTSLTSPNLESILNEVCKSRPLHHAAKSGNSSAVAYLLECGASPLSGDRSGFLPIQYAAMFGHRKIGDILITKLTKSEKKNQKKLHKTYSQYYDKYLNFYGHTRGDTGKSKHLNVQTYEQLITNRFDHIKKQLEQKGVDKFSTEYHVNYTDGESCEIKEAVAQFLSSLKKRMASKNEKFEGDIEFVGSSEDNVRLYCPDEYDCNLLLKTISAYPDGGLKAELTNLEQEKIIEYGHRQCLEVQSVKEELKNLLKGTCFLDDFYSIARESLTEMDLTGNKLKVIMPGIKRTQVGINLSFLWLGIEYPMLFIDIDFVPTVRAPWPEGLPKPNSSLDRCHMEEVYLNNVGEDEWRLSFGPTETKIMRGLSVNKRDVFLVCKMILAAFKMENWVPAEIKNQFMYWDSRMFSLHSKGGFALKNCFFEELENVTNDEEWVRENLLKRAQSVFERMCFIEEQPSVAGDMEVMGPVEYPKPVKAYFGGDTEKTSIYLCAPEIVKFLRRMNQNFNMRDLTQVDSF